MMSILRTIRSTRINHLPATAIHSAQQGFEVVRRDVEGWLSLVDFLRHPVDVNLALENGDIDISHSRRAL